MHEDNEPPTTEIDALFYMAERMPQGTVSARALTAREIAENKAWNLAHGFTETGA